MALIGQGRRLRKTDGKSNRETSLMQISYHKEDSHQLSLQCVSMCVYVSGCCVCVCVCAVCVCSTMAKDINTHIDYGKNHSQVYFCQYIYTHTYTLAYKLTYTHTYTHTQSFFLCWLSGLSV